MLDLQEFRLKTSAMELQARISGAMQEVLHGERVHSFKVQERAVPPPAPSYRMYTLQDLTKADMSSESQEKNAMF